MKLKNFQSKNKLLLFKILAMKALFFSLFLFFSFSVFAQQDASNYRIRKVHHRVSAGPALSFYKNNPLHTINTKAKSGFNAAYKCEIKLGRKTNFLAGLEYMSQGLKFNGYYSAPNHTYLFDKTFSYTHEIRFQEIQLPLAFKVALKQEKDNLLSPYVFLGPGFKYITKSTAFILSDSTELTVSDGKTDLTFENHLIDKHFNSFLHAGLGIQKNFHETGKAMFIEFTYKYNISRLHYVGNQNTNNLNIRNNSLSICIGLRF